MKAAHAFSRNIEIDRLRAVAILLVLVVHVRDFCEVAGRAEGALWARAGAMSVGVDLFFVISGFVVSAVIVERIDALGCASSESRWRGYFDFTRAFYAKRTFRILPMAWLVLGVFSFAFIAVWGVERTRYALNTAAAAIAFSANYFLYFRPPTHFSGSPFGPYWSLSIEEQFYFVYPLFLFAVRSRRRRMLVLAAAMAVVALVLRPLLFEAALAAGHSRAAFATHFRADGIMAGCLLYFLIGGRKISPRPAWADTTFVCWGGTLGLIAVLVEVRHDAPLVIALPIVVLVSMLLVDLAARRQGFVLPGRGVVGRALDWFGLRSYGLYLINWPLLWLLDAMFPGARALSVGGLAGFLLLWLLLSAVLAELGFRFVERPLMRRGAAIALAIEARHGSSLEPSHPGGSKERPVSAARAVAR